MENFEKKGVVDREYWNILKGIGIILVVVGHFCGGTSRFIYLFHLPLFFFISGYLYNEEKYGDNPYANLAARLKSSWMKYVILFWILIFLHNFLTHHKIVWIYDGVYSLSDIIMKMTEALFGNGEEAFGVTLWFVPALVIASGILGFLVSASRKLYHITNCIWSKYLMQAVIVAFCAWIGYYFEAHELKLHASAHVSLVVMPFLWGGYLLRNANQDYKKYLHPLISCIFVLVLYWVSQQYRLDLAMQSVYPMMHLIAFLGIYISMYIAKIIQKIPRLNALLAIYGRASFWIMFAHLVFCRLFDWIYIQLCHKEQFEELYYVIRPAVFAKQFWGIYLILGLGLTLLVYVLFEKVKTVRIDKIH